jgi:hypothetical protein
MPAPPAGQSRSDPIPTFAYVVTRIVKAQQSRLVLANIDLIVVGVGADIH